MPACRPPTSRIGKNKKNSYLADLVKKSEDRPREQQEQEKTEIGLEVLIAQSAGSKVNRPGL